MAHDVFISYSNLDRTVADAAVAVLESRKIRCWIAPRDVTPGLDWSAEIIDAIERASVMVLIYSSNANESPQIKREVERGVNRGIPVIPFRIEDVPLSKALEYFISSPHWLDAMTPPLERHLNYLADTVQLLLERRGGGSGEQLRKRMARRRRWGDIARKVRTATLMIIGVAVVAVGAWAWGRFGTSSHSSEPSKRPAGLDSLLEAVRAAPVPGRSARPTESTPANAAVDGSLVGSWQSTTMINGQAMRTTLVVSPQGSYRFDTVIADSGRFVFRSAHQYYLVSVTGSRVELSEAGVDASKATFTGPLGTQEWKRVGLPANSQYPIAGEWHTTALRDSVPWQMTLTIEDNRWQYRLISESVDEGTMEARNGQWTTHSRTQNGTTTTGSYIMVDDHTMSFTGPLGSSTWTRQR